MQTKRHINQPGCGCNFLVIEKHIFIFLGLFWLESNAAVAYENSFVNVTVNRDGYRGNTDTISMITKITLS